MSSLTTNPLQFAALRRRVPMALGLILVGALVVIAVIGPALAPHDPLENFFIVQTPDGEFVTPPFRPGEVPGFPLGSDPDGRDLLSRFLWAFRPTLLLAFLVAATRLLVGAFLGLLEGWFDNSVRDAAATLRRLALGVPILAVGIAVIYLFKFQFEAWIFIIALTVTGWANTAKIMSERTRLIRGEAFIEAARALGARDPWLLWKHVVPQARSLLIVTWAFEMSATLLQLAELGFLGFYLGGAGIRLLPDTRSGGFLPEVIAGQPELGQMLSAGWENFLPAPWLSLMAGSAFFLAIFSFMMLGEGMKRAFAETGVRPFRFGERIAPLLERRRAEAEERIEPLPAPAPAWKRAWVRIPTAAFLLVPLIAGGLCLLVVSVAILWNRFGIASTARAVPPSTVSEEAASAPAELPTPTAAPPTLGPAPTATAEGVVEVSPAEPVIYVPGGSFPMGSDASGVQGPIHQVTLSPYFIDRTEVTNAQYAECVAAGVCLPPPSSAAYDGSAYYGEAAYADYPVIYVGWEAANAYCRWRGARLPTEAEWEMAACWNPTTGVKTVYPWGDEWDAARLNLCDSSCLLSQFADPDHSDGWPQMAPVGSFPLGASPLGALDMAGNVAEWVADWFNPAYYAVSPSENPTGPAEGTLRVVRGGAWGINDTRLFTCTARSRFAPTSISAGLGFRCAQSAE